MLHYLDDLDSKMESMRAHCEREKDVESPWTSYNASLSRPVLDPEKFLRPKAEPVAAEPVAEAAASEEPEPVEESAVAAAAPSSSTPAALPLEKHIEALQNKFKPAASMKRDEK